MKILLVSSTLLVAAWATAVGADPVLVLAATARSLALTESTCCGCRNAAGVGKEKAFAALLFRNGIVCLP